MVQDPLLFGMDNRFLAVPSRQKSSFDICSRNGFAEHSFPEIERVEDRLGIALADEYERLPIVLHERLPFQDKTLLSRNSRKNCARRHSWGPKTHCPLGKN
jgi:hypothetical protein